MRPPAVHRIGLRTSEAIRQRKAGAEGQGTFKQFEEAARGSPAAPTSPVVKIEFPKCGSPGEQDAAFCHKASPRSRCVRLRLSW